MIVISCPSTDPCNCREQQCGGPFRLVSCSRSVSSIRASSRSEAEGSAGNNGTSKHVYFFYLLSDIWGIWGIAGRKKGDEDDGGFRRQVDGESEGEKVRGGEGRGERRKEKGIDGTEQRKRVSVCVGGWR